MSIPRTPLSLPEPANDKGTFSSGREAGVVSREVSLLGSFKRVYAGYASNPDERERVASGGIVSALMVDMLKSKKVDGVALSRTSFSGNRLGYDFDIVTDPDDVRKFATSSYFNIPIEKHWKQLNEFEGRVALCALPCHTSILKNRREKGRGLKNIDVFVSLFCGHNNEPELNRFVLRKAGIEESQVEDIYVDRTYLGGDVKVKLKGGRETVIPFRKFNVYRSLWFFSKSMCRYCDDHLGAAADISVGDIFLPKYRRKSIQHSAIIARTDLGCSLVEAATKSGRIEANVIDPALLFQAQKRIIVPSADLRSRYHANRIAGFPAKRTSEGRLRIRTLITYSLLHMNDRISQGPLGRKILWYIPRPLLYVYIALLKLIHNTLRA